MMTETHGRRLRLPLPAQCPTCKSTETVHEMPSHPGQFYCDKCQQRLDVAQGRVIKAMA